MSCPPVPLPASSLYTISSSQSFTPPRCGQQTMVVFCGNHANIPVGAHVEMLNPNGSNAVFRYKVVAVSAPNNGQYTVTLLNEGGAPDGGPIQTGNKEWIVVGSDWRDSCDSVPEREYATHLFVQTPPDPDDCCNPGCGCVGKIPITPGPVVFIPNPDLPGTYIPVSASSNVDLDFGGNINFLQNLNVAGNLCNPYAASQPPDPNAQAVGVNASGCLRRIPIQRFVPDRRYLGEIVNTYTNNITGTLAITGVPLGATHVVLRITMTYSFGPGHNGFFFLAGPNNASPLDADDIVGAIGHDYPGSDIASGSNMSIIELASSSPQIKWRATTQSVPPHLALWSSPGRPTNMYVTAFIDGFFVNA